MSSAGFSITADELEFFEGDNIEEAIWYGDVDFAFNIAIYHFDTLINPFDELNKLIQRVDFISDIGSLNVIRERILNRTANHQLTIPEKLTLTRLKNIVEVREQTLRIIGSKPGQKSSRSLKRRTTVSSSSGHSPSSGSRSPPSSGHKLGSSGSKIGSSDPKPGSKSSSGSPSSSGPSGPKSGPSGPKLGSSGPSDPKSGSKSSSGSLSSSGPVDRRVRNIWFLADHGVPSERHRVERYQRSDLGLAANIRANREMLNSFDVMIAEIVNSTLRRSMPEFNELLVSEGLQYGMAISYLRDLLFHAGARLGNDGVVKFDLSTIREWELNRPELAGFDTSILFDMLKNYANLNFIQIRLTDDDWARCVRNNNISTLFHGVKRVNLSVNDMDRKICRTNDAKILELVDTLHAVNDYCEN
jgi:hypothetical protein